MDNGGRERRTRRQVGVLGAAALAVAGVVASVQLLGHGGSEPSPAPAPPPHEATVGVPYWSAGAVHVGEQRIATEHRTLRYAGGTTLVGTSPVTGRSQWFLVDGTALVPVVDTPYPTAATVSPDGAVVALVGQVAEDRRELTLWDVAQRRPVAATDVAVRVECCDKSGELSVLGIDLDHRVLYVDRRTMLWTPGRAPVEVTGAPTGSFVAGSQQWPRGATHQQSGTLSGVFGTVAPDGVFQRQGVVASDQVGLWSPDGASFVSPDGHRMMAEGVDGRPSVDLPVPPGGRWTLVAWESPTTVLLDRSGPQDDDSGLHRVTGLARCDVEAMSCTELEPPATPLVWPVVGLW
ncbi:hypothetical protein [Nocardioides daeguensis]|uniref:WD40 repeat domain-containing protein n=1 Tax=Nocardioides daeguensis TaxID=908359 RepID=A0ABP6WBT4_9ACTN|nr:hypothetical protein [Nocardioides daeguensis]MBV6729606.1 hypothetical protein [Nocardioides daeguensis]MCR1775038.1 hypothetical protein [Nocardioides daeguensis]